MFEQIILGIIQGIAEWLPISSSGMIALAKKALFASTQGIEELSKESLFLHFGTFFAALIYLFKEVKTLCRALFQYPQTTQENKNILKFLLISTLISATIGIILIKLVGEAEKQFDLPGKFLTFLIGLLLLITAYLELKASEGGYKNYSDLRLIDAVLLGIAQGFAALPGLSRSGLTVSALLLRKFDKNYALKLSFLMSLPIVLGGNIVLHINQLVWSSQAVAGIIASFIFGFLTIHLLLKLAKKINFGYFLIFFGTLTILSALI